MKSLGMYQAYGPFKNVDTYFAFGSLEALAAFYISKQRTMYDSTLLDLLQTSTHSLMYGAGDIESD